MPNQTRGSICCGDPGEIRVLMKVLPWGTMKLLRCMLCITLYLRCRPHPQDFISSSLFSALLPALRLCFLLFVRGCLWMSAETVNQLTVHSFTSVWSELGEQSRLLPVTWAQWDWAAARCFEAALEIVPAEEDVRTWTGLTGFLQLLVVITKIFFVWWAVSRKCVFPLNKPHN